MGRPVTINGRELNFNDAPFIEANAEYSVTVDDDGTVVVERTDLKAENAKLRGIVAVLWECCPCNTDSFWCEGCDYHDVDWCKVKVQIDRLGIEV